MKFILLGFFPLVFARPDGYEPYDQPCTPGEHCPRNDNVTCGMYHIINKRKLEFPSYFWYLSNLFQSLAPMPTFMQNADRIVGGEAAPSMIPWQVAMLSESFQFCGGTVLDSCTILTAAHCAINTGHSIRAGSLNKQSGGQVYQKISRYLINL